MTYPVKAFPKEAGVSHRSSCPTEWEARSEGARAFNRGGSSWSNPYRDGECEEAEIAWRSGFRRAEQCQLEEEEERRYFEQMQYEQQQAEEYERSLAMTAELPETEERGDAEPPTLSPTGVASGVQEQSTPIRLSPMTTRS